MEMEGARRATGISITQQEEALINAPIGSEMETRGVKIGLAQGVKIGLTFTQKPERLPGLRLLATSETAPETVASDTARNPGHRTPGV